MLMCLLPESGSNNTTQHVKNEKTEIGKKNGARIWSEILVDLFPGIM